MTFIDYYLVQHVGEPDYNKALRLAQADDDVAYYVEELIEVLRDKRLDPDDMTEILNLNGTEVYVFQDHNGVGDGGSRNIGNSQWIATSFPDVFQALAITVSWSKGPKVLAGQADGRV